MRQILHIGHNDIRIFLRIKASYVWLFVVPLAFVYFMGVAFRGPGAPANPRPSVLIENHDTGFVSQVLLDELDAQGMRRIDPAKRDEAARGIRIPPDFTPNVLQKKAATIEFFQTQGAGEESARLVELRLARAVIALNSHLVEFASEHGASAILNESGLRAVAARQDPVSLKAQFAGRNPIPSGFNQSLPGNLTMFLMMNLLIFGGASISSERTNGVLRRLVIYPLRKYQLVFGKVYGLFLLGCVQIVLLLLAGRFLFQMNIGENLPAIFLTLVLYVWLAASLGVLIGSVVSNADKAIGLCVLATMIMAALGGCWWPLEIVSGPMKIAGHLFPTAWTMGALHQLISFGGSLATILPALGVLAIYALAANVAAGKLLRW
jgi:ABC-2 type transport system permease protein